ncbi:PhoPQ-activated pathogenicity-related family protein [soil metagenome]
MFRSLLLLLALSTPLFAQGIPPHLNNYIQAKDDAFTWKIVDTIVVDGNTITTIKMTSQKWQGHVWEHDLQIFLPKDVKLTATMLLMNDGGTAGAGRTAMGLALAQRAKCPVAFVYGVPKQPIDGKKEDALIAETFIKYLETKDPAWPLLFPMVKTVIKAMDAVQAFAKQEWKHDVTGFIITGASKRGWTTWLTAATGDVRVKAIAPMVFDSLNMLKQMPHQVASFGDYSLMIKDYKERKLLPLPETDDAKALWAMVDPWVYREKVTVPKLIVNGTNDPYWTQDALNLYWNDLKGPKNVLYVPNAGHDLRPMEDPAAEKDKMKRDLTPMKAIDTIAAFSRTIIEGKTFPVDRTKIETVGLNGVKVTFDFESAPKVVKIWKAGSDTRDFRKQKWTEAVKMTSTSEDTLQKGTYGVACTSPFNAVFSEAEYELDGQKYYLSTPITIVEKK